MTRMRFSDGGDLAARARAALEGGADTLTVDLADVERVDPAALRELGALVERARAAGATVRFEGAPPAVHKALHLARLL